MEKLTLITGASKGIGKEFARIFAKNGHDLVLVARSADALKELARELEDKNNVKVTTLVKDLDNANSAAEIYEFTGKNNLKVEYLINNAGFGSHGKFHEINMVNDVGIINVNITSLVQLTKLFLGEMVKENRGKILNVASTAGFQPGPFMAVYYASKAFVLSFSEALTSELSGTNVNVSVLCPGPVKTEFQKVADMQKTLVGAAMPSHSAKQIAKIGYKGLKRNKAIIIPGLINNLLVQSLRITPRFLIRTIAKFINK